MKKRTILSALAATSVLALSACGGGGGDPLSAEGDNTGSSGSQVIVGSADFTESQLIGSIYSQALQAAGVDVKEQFNIGSREVYIAALKDGSIDLVPEYSGALLSYLDPKSTASTSEAVSTELASKFPSGITKLTPSPAEVKEMLDVDLPHPRDQLETKELAEFTHLRAHVYRLIKRDTASADPRVQEPAGAAEA